MSSSFPLLRLPRVVLCEVFKSLSIGEKIKLSLCSTKVSIQINNARLYSQKVIAKLNCLRHKVSVYSENNKDKFEIFIFTDSGKTLNSNTQQCSINRSIVRITDIFTFCKNYPEGFLSVTQHLLKMFRCKISTDCSFYNSDLFQPTILLLFDLQVEFKTLTIHLNGSKNDKLLWNQISSSLELVENLTILSNFYHGFPPVFTSWPQKITIINCYWFTLESLLACTSTTITLWNSRLKNKDFDEILRKWKTGGFPNLERLKIISHNITNNGTTILGMNLRELSGKVIQTDDESKKATIRNDFEITEMSVFLF